MQLPFQKGFCIEMCPYYCVRLNVKDFETISSLYFRLCSLTLTRLVILKPLENDLNSVILAVKMQVCISFIRPINKRFKAKKTAEIDKSTIDLSLLPENA